MAFPFVLACFGKILQSGGVEVEEDASLVQRKRETLLRIQDRSRSSDGQQEVSQFETSEEEANSPSLDASFELQQEQANDESFRGHQFAYFVYFSTSRSYPFLPFFSVNPFPPTAESKIKLKYAIFSSILAIAIYKTI